MSLLLPRAAMADRRAAAAGPLAPLADGLAAELAPVIERFHLGKLLVPSEKALLSRVGGRCEVDGELLEFDPESPHAHRCARCGRTFVGEWHDRFWPYWYQLWLAERAVHGALLYRLRGDNGALTLARGILDTYADRYLRYPNRDNVLGPSRPFFSTYLESIWLLQLCLALDLLEEDDVAEERATSVRLGARVRERIVEPSVALIASYDEGMSNRQVWNNAALLAARTLLGQPDAIARVFEGTSGVLAHLERALLVDGTWYEGENYHLFAHRGLWYAVTMADVAGFTLPAEAERRFRDGFAAPFASALPDLVLPSRRDSQFAIALRQPRFAELCELGLARGDDERLLGALAQLYEGREGAGVGSGGGQDGARTQARKSLSLHTGMASPPTPSLERARSTADVERNRPGEPLTRADLGWRSLLLARPTLPPLVPRPARSALLDGQGLAIFRRERARRYVALDYGHSGGGHGHPDRLNLLVAEDGAHWLDDMGTGSYVERTLHWYRSTLAHQAPLVDGRSQRRVDGRLLAHEERGGAGWVRAEADIAPGVRVRRTVVAMSDYVVDRLEWETDRVVTLDLPFHVDGESEGVGAWASVSLAGGGALEDGFDFARDTEGATLDAGRWLVLRARDGDHGFAVHAAADGDATWWRARAPGPPGAGARRFHAMRVVSGAGRIDAVLAFDGAVRDARRDGDAVVVTLADGTSHTHAPADWGWHIDLAAAGARSSIDLGGLRAAPPVDVPAAARRVDARTPIALDVTPVGEDWLSDDDAPEARRVLRAELGESHYVRSEESWREAGEPTARVSVAWDGEALVVEADVRTSSAPRFVAAGTENPYDNEPAEVNGDGVQLYAAVGACTGGWLLVPEPGGGVRARPVSGWSGLALRDARWRAMPGGYTLRARVALPHEVGSVAAAIDVVVNETGPDRVRRRGQLVLSGGGGFVYLRGDRHDAGRLVPLTLQSPA